MNERVSHEPLTLGELADFFLGAWDLISVVRLNTEHGGDLDHGFFSAESEFYPDFDRLIHKRVAEHFAARDQSAGRCPASTED